MVSCSFHSPPGVLFTFPSRYCFTIGHSGIFSLTRWSSQIHTEFHVLHATWDSIWLFQFSNTRLSLSMVKYSKLVLLIVTVSFFNCPTTLNLELSLGCSRFARRYSGNRFYFLFLQVLRCFSSLGSLLLIYEFNKQLLLKFPHSETSGS